MTSVWEKNVLNQTAKDRTETGWGYKTWKEYLEKGYLGRGDYTKTLVERAVAITHEKKQEEEKRLREMLTEKTADDVAEFRQQQLHKGLAEKEPNHDWYNGCLWALDEFEWKLRERLREKKQKKEEGK